MSLKFLCSQAADNIAAAHQHDNSTDDVGCV